MSTVRTQVGDGILFWLLPTEGRDLTSWLNASTFMERSAIPSYDDIAGCLDRGVRGGIVPQPKGRLYAVTPDWHRLIHAQDGKHSCSELDCYEFDEWLVATELHSADRIGYVLNRDEYEQAKNGVEETIEQLFGR